MNKGKVTAVVIFISLVLFFSTLACEEGGLLDTQPYPPIARTARAETLTR